MSGASFPLLIKATAGMYLDCVKAATSDLRRSWRIIIGSLAAYFVYVFSMRLLAPFGMVGSFLVGLVAIALLSIYYSWIAEAVNHSKFSWRDLCRFDFGMFSNLISVAFILFLVDLLCRTLVTSGGSIALVLGIKLMIVLVFNAVPEVIHQRHLEGVGALSYSAAFTKQNWIEWFIPLLVMVAPILLLVPSYILLVLAQSEVLLPTLTIINSWEPLGNSLGVWMSLSGLVLGSWFMLFRARLFVELDSGTRRRRVYQAGQK